MSLLRWNKINLDMNVILLLTFLLPVVALLKFIHALVHWPVFGSATGILLSQEIVHLWFSYFISLSSIWVFIVDLPLLTNLKEMSRQWKDEWDLEIWVLLEVFLHDQQVKNSLSLVTSCLSFRRSDHLKEINVWKESICQRKN